MGSEKMWGLGRYGFLVGSLPDFFSVRAPGNFLVDLGRRRGFFSEVWGHEPRGCVALAPAARILLKATDWRRVVRLVLLVGFFWTRIGSLDALSRTARVGWKYFVVK